MMGRFSLSDGKIAFNKEDGAMSPDDVVAFTMMQVLDIVENIDDRLRGIEHALSEGELKVHRTQ